MAAPRAVRIARAASAAPAAGPSARPHFVPNRAGDTRARRLFLLFAVLLVAIYATFAALTLSNPVPGVRENLFAWAAFSLLALALALWGWSITIGRAPRGVLVRSEELLVRERLGGSRRVLRSALDGIKVVQRYPAGWIAPEPTVLAEVRVEGGRARTYLVGESFFADLSEPAA